MKKYKNNSTGEIVFVKDCMMKNPHTFKYIKGAVMFTGNQIYVMKEEEFKKKFTFLEETIDTSSVPTILKMYTIVMSVFTAILVLITVLFALNNHPVLSIISGVFGIISALCAYDGFKVFKRYKYGRVQQPL